MKQLLLVFITLLLVGCAPAKPIEQLGIITTYGVDVSDQEEGLLDNTILYTQFDPDAPQPMQSTESISKTYHGAISNANLKTSFDLVTGQIQLKVFGTELAEQGLMRLISSHMRDAQEPGNIYIAVAEPTAKDVLMSQGVSDTSKFLDKLIQNNIKKEILPKSNFFDFSHKFDDPGIDPIQPVITIENQKPVIDRIGLFKDDRYVGSLSPEETFLVKLIIEKYRAGRREVTLPRQPFEEDIDPVTTTHQKEKLFLTLSEINSKAKVTLEDKKNLNYKVDIEFESRFLEASAPLRMDDKKVLTKVEKEISKLFTKQLDAVTEKIKELGVDPIGFGVYYNSKTKHRELTAQEWREKLPNINVDYNVNVEIIRHGIME